MDLILDGLEGFTKAQQDLIIKAVDKSRTILKWPEWVVTVKNSSFSETSDSGDEILIKMSAKTISIKLKEFHTVSSTIAYTLLHGDLINLNSYYLDQYVKEASIEGEASVASTIIHEFMHEIGYTHRHFWSKKNSVPYRMQHIFYDKYVEYYSEAKADLLASPLPA